MRSMILILVSFLTFGCTASIQTPVAVPLQKQSMFLKNGDCNPKAEEATVALCKMGKKVELLEKQLAEKMTATPTKPAATVATAAVQPVVMPGFNHIPFSTGVTCTSQDPLTVEVTNSTDQFLEVVKVDGGVTVSPCDMDMLTSIYVAPANGVPKWTSVIPPGKTVRFIAVVYTHQNGVLRSRLGRKSVDYNAYMVMGMDPAPRMYHWTYTYDFPRNSGRAYLQNIQPAYGQPG